MPEDVGSKMHYQSVATPLRLCRVDLCEINIYGPLTHWLISTQVSTTSNRTARSP